MTGDRLSSYRKKRNFKRTSEPRGSSGSSRGGRRFVIQKHDASSLHYDFRLEVKGVLVSWAVPKGPSTNPADKRLAIQTEDHPLDYAQFEGCIPAGEYGAGTVMVWDTGTYRNLRAEKGRDSKSMEASLEDGLVEVWLQGEKLSGGYALKRMQGSNKPQWLLIKMDDQAADARRKPVSTEPDSVKTGRSMARIAAEEGGGDD
ncbi:DNA polymerase ligase N-terminal domain-containing protein [Marinobacter sp. M216]|uniref:DNA polymerase ligase N-terminal domain-containing protein n=1 Tax=Marinobacter albus TaxID=3030833 RepID=A0ABT7HC88_9GAMM|nr:DNA polymerase ligase N-terminal domain-containing protein [Marinobacter sp. M216]MDK9557495.1 DNA polymerase ligase N-terminal domain-containing protein [Marinobacter sp. M216]